MCHFQTIRALTIYNNSCDRVCYITAGMSLITNVVILEHDSEKTPPSHQEVMETGRMRAIDMHRLVKTVIEKLSESSAKQSHKVNGKK